MLKSSMREKMIKCIQRKVEPQTEGMHSVGLTFYKKKEKQQNKKPKADHDSFFHKDGYFLNFSFPCGNLIVVIHELP